MRSKKAAFSIITNLLLQLVTIAYGFIVPKIIIANFGSETNGLVASITQFLTYIILLESGFGPVIKAALYGPISKKDRKTVSSILHTSEKFFKKIALIFLAYIAILCLLYPIIVGKYDWIFTASLIVIIGISTFAEYFFGITYRLYLQAKQKAYIVSLIQIATYILSTIVIIIMAKTGASIHAIKLISGIIFVIRPIAQNFYVKKKYNITINSQTSEYRLKQKWDALAQHVAAVIHGNTDITVLTLFSTLTEVSVYSVYYLVVKGIKAIIQALTSGIDATFGDMLARKEIKTLNKRFATYEVLYSTASTIVFSCAIVLITPFIGIYTQGINDADYIRPLFGALIVISEYIWAIRLPYSTLTNAAGHFRQTKKGAWVECLTNIIISIILVNLFGIVGVAIGTIVAMAIRTVELIVYANRHILNRDIIHSAVILLATIIDTIAIIYIGNHIAIMQYDSYLGWAANACLVLAMSIVITIIINLIIYKNQLLEAIRIVKHLFARKGGEKGTQK